MVAGARAVDASSPDAPPVTDRATVFAAALVVAVGGIVYELILGTAASYLLGDSITAFSVATGLTLFGMGVGSLLAARLARDPGLGFVRNEVVLSLLGGNSVLLLYATFAWTELAWLVFALLSVAIGVAIGVEIPLLIAMLRSKGSDGAVGLLSKVLALDYFGALVASLIFPFVLLPYLGLVRTAYAVAVLNVLVAIIMLRRVGRTSPRTTVAAWTVLALLVVLLLTATRVEANLGARLYADPVVHYERTGYQKVVVTDFRGDVRLYLNDQLQFSSVDEARYHETLAHAALTSVPDPQRVLILGGGDGLLAREALRYPDVEEVVVVDLDPAVTELAATQRLLTDVNGDVYADPRVRVINADAFRYVDTTEETYDAVLVDLVDPSNERIAKLYSREFYVLALDRLSPAGVFATQATSSYFTPNAFWQVVSTLEAGGGDARSVVPLGVNVPSFGEWGFAVSLPTDESGTTVEAGTSVETPASFTRREPLPDGLRYHDLASLRRTAALDPDHPGERRTMPATTLLSPTIYRTYTDDMRDWRY